ncbi:MAG: vitamin K epoxide reductase family protein [Pseudomonadota bacterium]
MARKSRQKKSKPVTTQPKQIYAPDWIVLGLAGFGLLITGYLVLTTLTAAAPIGCGVGSSCDVIQSSRWSKLFGVPVSLFGFGLYLVIALIAGLGRPRPRRWQQLWSLSVFGLIFSLYLTLVGWFELQALCAWCTTSLATLVVLFAYLSFFKAEPGEAPFWNNFLISNGAMVLVAMVALHGIYNDWFVAPADPKLVALAEHLDENGAVFYGAFWCPACQDQKSEFGKAADSLPYVECSPNGRNAGLAFECAAAEIVDFPTWIIGERRLNGVQSPEDLARYTRFDWEGWQPDA